MHKQLFPYEGENYWAVPAVREYKCDGCALIRFGSESLDRCALGNSYRPCGEEFEDAIFILPNEHDFDLYLTTKTRRKLLGEGK